MKKQRKDLQLGDPMITNSLGDLEGPQTIFSQKQEPKIGIECSSNMWEIKVFENETTKENTWKKFLIDI